MVDLSGSCNWQFECAWMVFKAKNVCLLVRSILFANFGWLSFRWHSNQWSRWWWLPRGDKSLAITYASQGQRIKRKGSINSCSIPPTAVNRPSKSSSCLAALFRRCYWRPVRCHLTSARPWVRKYHCCTCTTTTNRPTGNFQHLRNSVSPLVPWALSVRFASRSAWSSSWPLCVHWTCVFNLRVIYLCYYAPCTKLEFRKNPRCGWCESMQILCKVPAVPITVGRIREDNLHYYCHKI